LRLLAGAVVLPAAARSASAQTYPSRPVRIIIGFAAGGAFDITARLIGQRLLDRLGQPFIVENRPGAGTNLATEAVVRAPPDGYTLLLGGAVNAVNATLYEKLKFDFVKDIAPVAGIIRFPNLMEVSPSFPAKSVPEFIAYAKANPGKITFASTSTGSTQHLAGELFKMMTGVNMGSRSLPRSIACTHRSDQRTSACDVRTAASVDRVHPVRQAARAGGDDADAFAGAAGCPYRGRIRAGL
jgi:tripartite-type tricarboxylate transporter receptor subunit TctC